MKKPNETRKEELMRIKLEKNYTEQTIKFCEVTSESWGGIDKVPESLWSSAMKLLSSGEFFGARYMLDADV